MELIAPAGPVYQAGTLSGNPLAMTAGLVTLEILKGAGVWEAMEAAASQLEVGIGSAAQAAGIPIQQRRVGTMFTTFFTQQAPRDWPSVKTCDTARFGRFFRLMLEQGVYLAPSQFEAGFVSTAHTEDVIERTIDSTRQAFAEIAKTG